jgi:hypothetical protein
MNSLGIFGPQLKILEFAGHLFHGVTVPRTQETRQPFGIAPELLELIAVDILWIPAPMHR